MKVLRSLEKIRSLNTRKNSESSEESSQLLKSDEGMQVFRAAPSLRRVLLHAKHEVVAILKLKGHVIPTALGDVIAARIPDV